MSKTNMDKSGLLKLIIDYFETLIDTLSKMPLDTVDILIYQKYRNAIEHIRLALNEVQLVLKLECGDLDLKILNI